MKDFLRFLQSLNNATEAYLSTNRENINKGELILYYKDRTDEYLAGEVQLLQEKLEGKDVSITIRLGSKTDHYDILISACEEVPDGFTLIDVNINPTNITEIEDYLQNNTEVTLALKKQEKAFLTKYFTLFLDMSNDDKDS